MNASLRRGTSGDEIHSARIGIAIVLLLVLAGCGTLPPRGPGGEPATPVETAESLSMQGRHEASADLYQQMARQAGAVPRQRYLILTARERHLAGTPEVARTILNRLSLPIDASNRLLWAQVSAEVAISMGNPARALANLDSAPPAETAADATNILLIRGHALFRLGQPVAATAALLEREVWLEKKSAIAANQRLLWEGYRTWGVRSVAGDAIPGDDPIMRGWLALGEIAWTRRTEPAAMRRALLSWRDDYPNHPANRLLIRELISGLPAAQAFPRRVALLLPLTGQARQAAAAIRDGFLAAHFSATELPDRPAIRIYDVSSLGVAQAYRQAVDEGATFVVGPLMKTAVRELSAVGVTTPTLTLNFLPDDAPAPAGLYQFSLSPEDEARQVAQRSAGLGQSRALALAPNTAWGRRVLTSFMREFELRGGQTLDYRFYDPGNPDFSSGIQELLLIDESRARRDRLSANLGVPLEYEPRRRSDVDLIFLAATEKAGKLIRPQLRFHYAGAVPTYSTSAIYQEGTRNNSDLNGIMFPDIPWIIEPDGQSEVVRETIARHWPGQANRRSRLYALGFDAYRLIPTLNSDARWRAENLPGMTGTLYIDDRNR
ncbi:MAG: penicillin-binding protein activator, partial [Gammaproteobacteria bacterium]